jgi:predicted ATPase/class 3 adenylate cyclase
MIETLTFLATDIEGSTALLRRLGDGAYSRVLAEHHEIVRTSFEAHGGREEGTQGDSFFVVFGSTSACVAAAIDMQRRLGKQQLPGGEKLLVRMGIHTGEASNTVTGLVGYEVHRTARIANVAHGGQILLSSAASSLVKNSLPEGVSLLPLGFHRLKDLGQPEEISQVVVEGLASDFPGLKSLDNVGMANNLPTSLSPFVGRIQEIAEIADLIRSSRLVTLTGSGGSGKTRLALQVAAELLDGSAEGVWFVGLDAIGDPETVPIAVYDALKLSKENSFPSNELLADVLKEQDILIVLDNCEHVVGAVAKLADLIGRSCPKVRLIATSREPLGVSGEVVYRVRSLSLPGDNVESVEDLAGYDAVDLLVARAKSYDRSFSVDDANAAIVASICTRLDGIPLAIELAASRLSSMSLDDLHKRLDQRFRLLTGGGRNALPRQQTLGAMVAWSYDLLSDVERELLRRLTVFVGSFDIDAVESICSSESVDSFEAVELIGSLVNKSLVVAERNSSGIRFHLLETIRQYALEQLLQMEGPESLTELGRRHAAHYLALCEEAELSFEGGPHQVKWISRANDEWGNIQAAFSTFADQEDYEAVLRIESALFYFLTTRRYTLPAAPIMSALEKTEHSSSLLRAESLRKTSDLIAHRRIDLGLVVDTLAVQRQLIDEALRIAKEHRDERLCCFALLSLGRIMQLEEQSDGAVQVLGEALEIARSLKDDSLLGYALTASWHHLHYSMDVNALLVEAADCFRRAQNLIGLSRALHLYSTTMWDRALLGDARLQASVAVEQEVLEIARAIGDDYAAAQAIGNMGIVAFAMGDIDIGEEYSRQCLQTHRRMGEPNWQASCIVYIISYIAISRGDLTRGAQLYGAAQLLKEQFPPFAGFSWADVELQMIEEYGQRLHDVLGEESYVHGTSLGRTLPFDDVYRLALVR